jgi:hypothetical protein
VKLARVRKPKAACFLSYVEYRPNTNKSSIIYTYIYIQNMYSEAGWVEETKGGRKGDKTQQNTLKTVKQHRIGKKNKDVQWRGITLT